MTHILRFLFVIFTFINISTVYADTETLNWYIDDNIYATTTCESGSDIILPTTPTKYGYTFKGWNIYRPIEYLESTGTQYIDTLYYPNHSTEIEAKKTKVSIGEILGSQATDTSLYITKTQWASYKYTTYTNPITDDYQIATYKINKHSEFYINDTRIGFITNVPTSWLSPRTFVLFGLRRSNTSVSFSSGRIQSVKIWDNDVLVRDFIPVLDENGIPCMFDQVEGKFYYNAGTGDFIAGPVIDE